MTPATLKPGVKISKWTIIRQAPRNPKRKGIRWFCRCTCGDEKIVPAARLKDGRSKGCYKCRTWINRPKLPYSAKRLRHIWEKMHKRCEDPKHQRFNRYGARGISVCAEWVKYPPFRDWAVANGYRDDLTIDRRDNDGNYEPSNCRWLSRTEQDRNLARNRFYDFQGERLILADIATRCGIPESVIRGRLKNGWDIEVATSVPVHRKGAKRHRLSWGVRDLIGADLKVKTA